MKHLKVLAIAAVLVCGSTLAMAAEVTSGLKAGEPIGPFNVTKLAGAESDGVKVGNNLCYRCKNGSRPQVMVFTRSADSKVVALVNKLDEHVSKNSDKQLRVFVNYLGDSKDAASEGAKKLAADSKAANVPFVVPNEFENGPEDYGLNAKAEITVMVANEGKVTQSIAFSKASDLDLAAVEKAVEKALK
jgi:hypothetical protein